MPAPNSAHNMDPAKAKDFFEARLSFTTGPVELERMRSQADTDFRIVDVREPEDYEQGHIPGAINLPRQKWDSYEGLSHDCLNVLYCYNIVCHLATTAAVVFASKGYPVMELEGGFETWQEKGMPVESGQGQAQRQQASSMPSMPVDRQLQSDKPQGILEGTDKSAIPGAQGTSLEDQQAEKLRGGL
jgi:rhodanese-related sulfurtransferase